MVKVVLASLLGDNFSTTSISDASPHVMVMGTVAATLLAYSLFFRSAPHEAYAKKHGLTHVKLARRHPRAHWLLGDAPELSKNVTRFPDWGLDRVRDMDEQPHVLAVPFMGTSITIVDPTLVEDVIKTQNDVFGKGERMLTLFHDLIGDSLTMQDGATWFHQRKIASKFFSARMYREVATKMINKHADKLCAVLTAAANAGNEANLSRLFHEFTLQTFAELGFGLEMNLLGNEDGHPLDEALGNAFPQILYRAQTPQWFWRLQRWLNVGSERKYAEITHYIRTLVGEMVQKSIEQTRVQGTRQEAATIVELFVQAAKDGESGITPQIMSDVAIAFAIGGRDTTADTLNWMFFVLSKYPAVEQKLRAELWEKVPELMRGESPSLSMDQAASLTYLEAVAKETLRLYPPVPASTRQANRDTVLVDGTFVAKGTSISIPIYAMGRLTSLWGDDADEFKPERFLDETTGKLRTISSFHFTSFHGGPRICIGMNLAMLEIKLMIAMLLSRFELEYVPNDGSYKFSATLTIKSPLMASVRPAQADPHS